MYYNRLSMGRYLQALFIVILCKYRSVASVGDTNVNHCNILVLHFQYWSFPHITNNCKRNALQCVVHDSLVTAPVAFRLALSFYNSLQGSFIRVAHSILPYGLRGMAKLAILRNPHSVPFCPPLWLALCDVK